MTEIHTPRLVLRRWTDDDLVPMAEINADPVVMRLIGDGTVLDLEQTAEAIERWEEEWDEEGFGLFAVELLASGELAGCVGLTVPDFLGEVAVSWRLGRAYWGQGYASEAAHAALEFALEDRGLDRVLAVVRVGDAASQSVLDKLGMELDREMEDPEFGYPIRVHAIDLTQYS
ncbi:GNAT family N-acetyltransferase [Kitasatospora sp. NPDC057015]|uniref:GNAT family N-acetyltransferase n=1 Tax=Kitasatospora sp. NPDC057015 TaxID=3346001 RepID=UPI00362D2EDD